MGGCKPISSYLITPPSNPVAPLRDGEKFEFGAKSPYEMALFDSLTTEHIDIIGTTIWYYNLNLGASERDPLYDEPVKRVYTPFIVKGFVTLPEGPKNVGLEGFNSSWDATAYISRKSIEAAGAPNPGEGDIIRIWDVPYFNREANIDGFPIPDAGFYFSITAGGEDGHIFDTPSFTTFTATLRRVSTQTAERRLRNEI